MTKVILGATMSLDEFINDRDGSASEQGLLMNLSSGYQ